MPITRSSRLVIPSSLEDCLTSIGTLWPDKNLNPENVTETLRSFFDRKMTILHSDMWNAILAKVVKESAGSVLGRIEVARAMPHDSLKQYRRGIIAGACLVEATNPSSHTIGNDPLVRTHDFVSRHPDRLDGLGNIATSLQNPSLTALSRTMSGELAPAAQAGIVLVLGAISIGPETPAHKPLSTAGQ